MLVRYYGHVGLPTGYGDAAAEMCMAILSAGLDLEISTDGDACHKRFLPLAKSFKNEHELSPPDAVIVHTLPLDCEKILIDKVGDRFPKAMTVAYTTWEGASLIPPEMARSLSVFGHVWVPSSATARCMTNPAGSLGVVGCAVVPHPFDESLWTDEGLIASYNGGPGPYRFYYIGAWTARKNVDGIIRAYLRAFTADDDVELVIQSHSAPESACHVAQLSSGLGDKPMPTIRFSNRRMSHDEIAVLHREANCFVTASRGEAWNLPAFDALLARRHVIAPGGMGSDEFLKGTSADLYGSRIAPAHGEVRLVDAPDVPAGYGVAHYVGHQGLSVRSDWRDPDICELADMMASAYAARLSHLQVKYDPCLRFGRVAVGRRIADLLQGASR